MNGIPLPQVSIKWFSPLHETFRTRLSVYEHAKYLCQQEVLLDRHLHGYYANGTKMTMETSYNTIIKVPTRALTFKVGKIRFERDGLWIVGQEQSWQQQRLEEDFAVSGKVDVANSDDMLRHHHEEATTKDSTIRNLMSMATLTAKGMGKASTVPNHITNFREEMGINTKKNVVDDVIMVDATSPTVAASPATVIINTNHADVTKTTGYVTPSPPPSDHPSDNDDDDSKNGTIEATTILTTTITNDSIPRSNKKRIGTKQPITTTKLTTPTLLFPSLSGVTARTTSQTNKDKSKNNNKKMKQDSVSGMSFFKPNYQSYCLNAEQIQLCYTAGIEHYDQIIRTVTARGLTQELADGFDLLRERGKGRFDMELPIFDHDPRFQFLTCMKQAPWMPIVRQILGKDVVLIHKGMFLAMPGCDKQDYHQDGLHLNKLYQKPCHAINVFIPLVDMTSRQIGPTEFCLGSHILGQEAFREEFLCTPLVPAGCPIIFDYRLGHRGLANGSKNCRPIVYCTYAPAHQHKEFRDSMNFSRKRYHKIGNLVDIAPNRYERAQKRQRTIEDQLFEQAIQASTTKMLMKKDP
jgi:Phytanoyl-CoA dioxygenase (PhyH)